MKKEKASQLTTFQLVQAVLNLSEDVVIGEPFGLSEPRHTELMMVLLNAISEDGEIGDLPKALKAAGLHFSLIRTLKANNAISRKGDGPWTLTKRARKKFEQLVDDNPSAQPNTPTSAVPQSRPTQPSPLDQMTLSEIGAHVKNRLADIDEQMKTVTAESERAIEEIERRRDERMDALRAERTTFVVDIKQLAGEV